MQPSVAKKVAQYATNGCVTCRARRGGAYTRGALNDRGALGAVRRRLFLVVAICAALVLPATAGGASEIAEPGSIEGVVTKVGGGPLKGVEACAFDVGEDEEFTECAETKASGVYEIIGLDEGPYRVEFRSGSSGLNLATQFWKNA